MLVPPVKTREVTRIPCLAESRSTQIPVWADFTRHGAQIVPKIDDRWTPPEPVAVIDAVNHEARLEHERMRDHRIVLGVGVLLDVEILLNANKHIADQLSIGEATVKSHVSNILSKLGANDRSHAVTIGLKRGIIELDIPQK
jgi:Bacterial regulatory proteins, luxR family